MNIDKRTNNYNSIDVKYKAKSQSSKDEFKKSCNDDSLSFVSTPEEVDNIFIKKPKNKTWKQFYDGWFTYYYNTQTGEKKFKLNDGDDITQE